MSSPPGPAFMVTLACWAAFVSLWLWLAQTLVRGFGRSYREEPARHLAWRNNAAWAIHGTLAAAKWGLLAWALVTVAAVAIYG